MIQGPNENLDRIPAVNIERPSRSDAGVNDVDTCFKWKLSMPGYQGNFAIASPAQVAEHFDKIRDEAIWCEVQSNSLSVATSPADLTSPITALNQLPTNSHLST